MMSKIYYAGPQERLTKTNHIKSYINIFYVNILILLSITVPIYCNAAEIHIKWTKPISRQLISEYKIHYGLASRDYYSVIAVSSQTSYTIKDYTVTKDFIPGVTYYFALTAHDQNGNESDYSDEVAITIPFPDTKGNSLTDNIMLGQNIALDSIDITPDYFSSKFAVEQAFDSLNPSLQPAHPQLEISEVQLNHHWKQILFSKPFIDPIVVAKIASTMGSDPAVVRIRNVDSAGFDIRLQEWEYLDDYHTMETVNFIAMERGFYTLEDGTNIEAGSFSTNNGASFKMINFSEYFNVIPVVTTSVTSYNETDTITGRLKNIQTTSFDYSIQEQENNLQDHVPETISFIAWEPSIGNIGNFSYEVSFMSEFLRNSWETILFQEEFSTPPIFIANIQTTYGGNTATLRCQYKDKFGVDIKIEEETSWDDETDHYPEEIGFILLGY